MIYLFLFLVVMALWVPTFVLTSTKYGCRFIGHKYYERIYPTDPFPEWESEHCMRCGK